MYAYHTRQDEVETYILQNENGSTSIEIVPERGCIISQYIVNNELIFYLDESTLINPNVNIRGGNPILFPISSYLENNQYRVNEALYTMKQHGFARNLKGTVVEITTNEFSASITTELTSNEATYEQYPFEFKLIMKYTLTDSSLNIEATVLNTDEKTMPFYLGYHPYFYIADKSQLEIIIPSSNVLELLPDSMNGQAFNFNQAESNVIYSDLQANSCHMIDHARSLKLKLTMDDVFKYVVIWALQNKDFVCIEPWMAPVNAMNLHKDVQYLQAGQTHTSTFKITTEFV